MCPGDLWRAGSAGGAARESRLRPTQIGVGEPVSAQGRSAGAPETCGGRGPREGSTLGEQTLRPAQTGQGARQRGAAQQAPRGPAEGGRRSAHGVRMDTLLI